MCSIPNILNAQRIHRLFDLSSIQEIINYQQHNVESKYVVAVLENK